MAKIERTVRMTVAVTFRAYDPADDEDQPYYASEELCRVVGGWLKDAVYDHDDGPKLTVVLSKLERKVVD